MNNSLKTILAIMLLLTCTNVFAKTGDSCSTRELADFYFKKGSVVLNTKAKLVLDSCYLIVRSSSCKLFIKAFGPASEEGQQISWDRLMAAVWYMKKKGLKDDQLLVMYGEEGDPLMVELSTTRDDGPFEVPAPHPCYSLHLPRAKRCVTRDGLIPH